MPYHPQVHGPLDASSCACFLCYRGMVRMHVHVYATVLNSLSTYAATTVVTLFFFPFVSVHCLYVNCSYFNR